MKVLEVQNLSKDFPVGGIGMLAKGSKRVLDNVSFTLEKGESVALIGPNGCGKTTLLKALATIYKPDEGHIKVFGYDAVDDRDRVRAAFSFVSPALNFQNKLTLHQTIRFFSGVLGKNPEDAMTFLKRMGILHMLDVPLEGFSEGQKAMVRLAIGLIKHPKILMLDEVVANLDVERKERVIDFVKEEAEYNDLTLLMVDHDPMVVNRLCTKVILLKSGGSILKITTVEELNKSFPYLFEVQITLKKEVDPQVLASVNPDFKQHGNLVRFFAENEEATQTIIHALLPKRAIYNEITTKEVSLVDVYYLLMEGGLGF